MKIMYLYLWAFLEGEGGFCQQELFYSLSHNLYRLKNTSNISSLKREINSMISALIVEYARRIAPILLQRSPLFMTLRNFDARETQVYWKSAFFAQIKVSKLLLFKAARNSLFNVYNIWVLGF